MTRPTKYNEKLADSICAELSEGKSLRSICLSDRMPNKSTVFRWFRKYPQFCDQYARAKEMSADALIEDILYIADDEQGDVQRNKLQVDTRKWLAVKLLPRKYGDKTTQDINLISHEQILDELE